MRVTEKEALAMLTPKSEDSAWTEWCKFVARSRITCGLRTTEVAIAEYTEAIQKI